MCRNGDCLTSHLNWIQIASIRIAYAAEWTSNWIEIHCAHTVFDEVRFLYITRIRNITRKEARDSFTITYVKSDTSYTHTHTWVLENKSSNMPSCIRFKILARNLKLCHLCNTLWRQAQHDRLTTVSHCFGRSEVRVDYGKFTDRNNFTSEELFPDFC